MRLPLDRFVFVLFCVAVSLPGHASEPSPARLSFNRDIRPILSENCFQCHGPDKDKREAELRLDRREDAIEALAFVPGEPGESELISRIYAEAEGDRMPPVDSNRTLTATQREMLTRWVKEGAEYESHWAFVPPTRPALPVMEKQDAETRRHGDAERHSPRLRVSASPRPAVENPIDAFVRAKLVEHGLAPAAEADRRTLIRRLSFDLTGLPPDARDVEAFVRSRDPRGYEKIVKQYLSSPHYGERMAIPWLDLVRYADTTGFHNDVPIQVWPYRDYVINAFNRNLPFDQFTREQIAGDMLPNSTIEQRVASGYNRLHRISAEGGIQDKEYLAKYSADRVRTTSTVFLGATMACAECHDHKFDPFTAKDFYRFAAIFSDLKEKGAYNLSGGFNRENLTEETIFESEEQKNRVASLEEQIARLESEMKSISNESLAASRTEWGAAMLDAINECALAWQTVRPITAESLVGTPLTIQEEDNSIVAGGENPVNDTYIISIPATYDRVTAVRVEAVPDARFPGDDIARAGSTFFISEIEIEGTQSSASSAPRRIQLAESRGSGGAEPGYPFAAAIDGDPATSLSFKRKRGGGLALRFAEPWTGGADSKLTVRIRHSDQHPYRNIGRFRLSVHTLPEPDAHPDSVPEKVLAALQTPVVERKPAQKKEITSYYRSIAPELAALRAEHTAAINARDYLIVSLPSMPVSKSVEPREIRVLPRGNWMDDTGEVVEPGVPGFMRQIVPKEGGRVTRLDLADWLVAPDNPLTARTFVNRVWRIFFGAGLTRTLEDLGSQGEWPSHPELLDWLAVEFRESGWDVKHLVELIVTSQTYRQSSQASVEAEERDPTNKFLARQTRFRLDAELVRDNALAIAGLLVTDKIGGASARPYQPPGYFAALNFPKREYVPDQGEGLHRRGVYTHWQRTFLHPSLMAFDAPAREECTADRSASNTPLQALVLLNDPTYVEAARVFAEKIMREPGARASFRKRLEWAFTRALSRPPTRAESKLLNDLHHRQRKRYASDEPAARELVSVGVAPVATDLPAIELAAWTSVARAILNLHETISRN